MAKYTDGENIVTTPIDSEMKQSFVDYAMSVIVSRALPDVRDGLKPVQRRILYAMRELGLTPRSGYRKCAKINGDTMGNYHPHGEGAIYDALVRMAQDFNLRYMLVDGQGNFGSIDGDSAAAPRYTEARFAALAEPMLADIEKNTVSYQPNYDETTEEPTVLPSAVPNLLINGCSGIAVGMATNIPPHNLNEIIGALLLLIENPDADQKAIMKHVPGPDFPTGGLILGRGGIRDAYTTGRGRIVMRARCAIERTERGSQRDSIIVTEIPYQVNKTRLIESIADQVRSGRITGISDLRDESDKDGMRIVIELKRDAMPQVVLNTLYKHTPLQDTFGVIMLALVDGRPRVMPLKRMMQEYLNHRETVVTRRTQFDLDKAEARAHIIEGLLIALDKIDAVIKLIRASETPAEARTGLMSKFKLSKLQAQSILDMRLQRLTGLEQQKLEDEYADLIKDIARLGDILGKRPLLLRVIRDELLEVQKLYADERRTEIVEDVGDLSVEDLIADEDMVISISHLGYIKRLPVSTYRKQRRGGRGVTGMGTRSEDFVRDLFIASAHSYLLVFTKLGRVYWIKVHEIPQAGRTSKGRAVANLLKLGPGDSMCTTLAVRKFDEDAFVLAVTRSGQMKKTALRAYSNPRSGGIIAMGLKPGDEVVDVQLTRGDDTVLIATGAGKAIHFNESAVRPMGRSAAGVRGIKLTAKDVVVGVAIPKAGSSLLVVSENGFGKRTAVEEYPVKGRGGQGVISMQTTKRNGRVVGFAAVMDEDEVVMITSGGIVVRTPVREISRIGRNTQGVRCIRVQEGDLFTAMAVVSPSAQESAESETPAESPA